MSNPTSNYSFQMPQNTDLVTDLPADFEIFGQAVDTRLKALQPGTTLGDLAYSSATANTNTRLAIGSTGNVLTVAGGVPTWAAPAAGGKVLQIVNAIYSTGASNSTNTFADTGLTATITPTLATSKILVMVTMHVAKEGSNTGSGVKTRILRNGTSIQTMGNSDGYNGSTATNSIGAVALNYLDSPASTSALTYKTQFANFVNAAIVYVQPDSAASSITLLEIGA